MNRINLAITIIAAVFLLMAFTTPVKLETYKVDTELSSIDWIGRKVTGKHNGKINISSGEVLVKENDVQGGSFTMDMNSIISDSEKLTSYLKNEDFFSVEKNPTSKFVITKVSSIGNQRINVSGDLTIKGHTESITFPASVKKKGNSLVAIANKIMINRAKFNIRYGSKSFFNDIANKAIDDEFELAINLVAKK
ncbi:MAG: YceI family protein [Flavobacterium sp.]|nr:YceI family protein [Pedobacter sp.]